VALDCIVVGGGLVGLGSALALLRRDPRARVVVLEKEDAVATHQSGRNSGVLHAGRYYTPGSAKARLAVQGLRKMRAFCEANEVPYETCGKIVVAVTANELPRLRDLEARGRANGLAGLAWLDRDAMREIEPHVGGLAALRVPEEGIVDYPAVARAMVRQIEASGGEVRSAAEVVGVTRRRDGVWVVETRRGAFEARWLLNCAGLQCDRVAELAGERRDARILPFRGEYYTLKPDRQHLVRHLIYPVPDPAFPFLGVHFTRMIGGGVECGPNAVLSLKREGYSRTAIKLSDAIDALGFHGLWHFMRRYPGVTWSELRRSFSKELFAASLQRLVPAVRTEDLAAGGAGVRAQAMAADGTLVQDFLFAGRDGAVHVINAPSPGATASLAIGEAIIDRLLGVPSEPARAVR
jgi:L-2-hydroxyglutarate oxidase